MSQRTGNFWVCVRPGTRARFGLVHIHALLCDGETLAPAVAPSRVRREQRGVCSISTSPRLTASRCRRRFSMDDLKIDEGDKMSTFISSNREKSKSVAHWIPPDGINWDIDTGNSIIANTSMNTNQRGHSGRVRESHGQGIRHALDPLASSPQ